MHLQQKVLWLQKAVYHQKKAKCGYVIREEQIIDSTNEKIQPIKNEGEKVSAGSPIFKYYNVDEQKINSQINELNTKIQEALEGKTDLPSSDVKALEMQIENQIDNLKNENNMQDILEYKNNISSYVVKKAKIAGSLSSAGQYINDLISQRNALEQTLNDGAEYVSCNISGVVSYRIDGLENELTVDKLDSLTTDYLKSLNLTTGQIVTKSENKAKVINNFKCYVAITFNSEEANKAKEGDEITLRLSSQEETKAKVYTIKNEGSNKLIIFEITDGVENLINYRKISLNVIWWKYSGLIVPKNSIIYENGKSYVLIKKNANFIKALVNVEKENDNYCVIGNYSTEKLIELGYTAEEIDNMKQVKEYDEIVVDPQI